MSNGTLFDNYTAHDWIVLISAIIDASGGKPVTLTQEIVEKVLTEDRKLLIAMEPHGMTLSRETLKEAAELLEKANSINHVVFDQEGAAVPRRDGEVVPFPTNPTKH